MISKTELQYYSSLLTKKYRQAENKFIVEGKKSVFEGLNSNYNCEIIFITSKFADENKDTISRLSKVKKKFISLKQKEFKKYQIRKLLKELQQYFKNQSSEYPRLHSRMII